MLSKLILVSVGCVSEEKMLVRRFSVWDDLNNLVSVVVCVISVLQGDPDILGYHSKKYFCVMFSCSEVASDNFFG